MTRVFTGLLSVIAVSLLLIAYGLLRPGLAASTPADVRVDPSAPMSLAAPTPASPAVLYYAAAPQASPPAAVPAPAVARRAAVPAARPPGRNWTKTALIIGGSTAAGAGIGGIFGGKKGALIGAAIGGGASSIQQATR